VLGLEARCVYVCAISDLPRLKKDMFIMEPELRFIMGPELRLSAPLIFSPFIYT
jgi:hypothetical protein